ncbi:MAG: hypothetical protein HRU22_17640, partial [Gammaproteobacteria bacterium]|nr:hypothetical protein [Gammaproteobacteria bacterium]
MSFITDTNCAIEQAIDRYLNCNAFERAILRILSVVDKRIGQTKFKAVLSELGHSESFYQQQLQTHFTPELKQKLIQQGLIDGTREGIKVSKFVADYLTVQTLIDNSFEDIIEFAEMVVPIEPAYHWNKPLLIDKLRQVRDCFYRRQFTRCIELLEFNKNPQLVDIEVNQVLIDLCFYPYKPQLFSVLPPQLQYQSLATLLELLKRDLLDNCEVVAVLASVVKQQPSDDNLRLLLAEQYLHRGDLNAANALISNSEKSTYGLQLSGWLQFLTGDSSAACATFTKAIVAKNRLGRRKKQYIGGAPGLMYVMALLQLGVGTEPSKLSELSRELEYLLDDYRFANHYRVSFMMIKQVSQVLSGKADSFSVAPSGYSQQDDYYSKLEVLFGCLCGHWAKSDAHSYYHQHLIGCVNKLAAAKQLLFTEIGVSLAHVFKLSLTSQLERIQTINLCDLIERKESWAIALEQLIALDQTPAVAPTKTTDKQTRIVWLLDPQRYGCNFEAKEQKLGKGGWSKGRSISLKRLSKETDSFDYLTVEDQALCR